MSQENVEVVRTYFRAWNAGDMEGVREMYDPDAVMGAAPDWPEPGPFVGRDAVMPQLKQCGVPSTMIPPSFWVTSWPWATG